MSSIDAQNRIDQRQQHFDSSYETLKRKNPLVEVMRFWADPYPLISKWREVVQNPGKEFAHGYVLDAPSGIKAPGNQLLPNEQALVIDMGGTSTKVGYYRTDGDGKGDWVELVVIKNEDLKPSTIDPNANLYEVYLDSLFKHIDSNFNIKPSSTNRLSVVWSNALNANELNGDVKGVGARFPQNAIFSKGEWFAPSIKVGDDLSAPILNAAQNAGMKLEHFLIMNDTIATAAAICGSKGGGINSTGTNGTLITKDGIYTNPEMGVGLYVPEDNLTSADLKALDEKRLDYVLDQVAKFSKDNQRTPTDTELEKIKQDSLTEVHPTLQDLAGGSKLFFARAFKFASLEYLEAQNIPQAQQLYLLQYLNSCTGVDISNFANGNFGSSPVMFLSASQKEFIQELADAYIARSLYVTGIMADLIGNAEGTSVDWSSEDIIVAIDSSVATGYEKTIGIPEFADEFVQGGAALTGPVQAQIVRSKTPTPMDGAANAILATFA